MDSSSVESDPAIARQAKRLLDYSRSLETLPGVPLLQHRLSRLIDQENKGTHAAPVLIALVGGTGAGKSELFNALLDKPNASPVSHTERLFTRKLHLAAHPSDLPQLPIPESVERILIESPFHGLCLIDTPDLDGAAPENREQARIAIEASDIIVYVALPEKRASFIIREELKQWAARKQWFFVLNQVDRPNPSDLAGIQEDFKDRLLELGFSPSSSSLFLVSATKPNHSQSEFLRLKASIFSSRTTEQIHALRSLGQSRAFLHAINDDVIQPIRKFQEDAAAAQLEIEGQVKELYLGILETPSVREQMSDLIRSRVWQRIPGKVGGFLALPLWISARFHQLWLTVSLTRLAAGGLSFLGIIQTLGAAAMAYIRGILPLQAVLNTVRRHHLDRLRQLRLDAVRKLEDLGVAWEEGSLKPEAKPDRPDQPALLGERLDQALRHGFTDSDPERTQVLRCLLDAVESASADTARRCAKWWHRFFGNLLPLIHFFDVIRKAILAWQEDRWLPGGFYMLAVFLFLLSTLPGCFLVAVSIRARAKPPQPQEIVAGLESTWEAEPLAEMRSRAERLEKRILHSRHHAQSTMQTLHNELQPEQFGTSIS